RQARRQASRRPRGAARLVASLLEVSRHRRRRRLGAQELGHEWLGGPLREIGERSLLHDPAVVQKRDDRAEDERLAHVMGDEYDGLSQLAENGYELRLEAGTRD